MKELVGALIFGQSGGPSSVINSSAAGVFIEALKHKNVITDVYGAAHGIKGILDEKFYDIGKEDISELMLLKNTPSSALGSVRYKLKPAEVDETDYKRLLEVFKKYNIRYFFYNGGNDSMDTCNKVSKYMQKSGYEMRVIGVPKTIDNDLWGTDHCPGYGSAAKYIATSIMELKLDSTVYNTGMVCVIEVMGRNAGWLTAAAQLAKEKGLGPDLIYLPETPFDIEQFKSAVKDICAKNNNKCMVVISEGIKNAEGKYIGEFAASTTDLFGHAQLGGVGSVLANIINAELGVKVRAIEFSLLQRCAAHLASQADVEEAFAAGAAAVNYALEGETDKMIILKRESGKEYKCVPSTMDVALAANTEKKIPSEWILPDGKGLTSEFVDYALPLILGDSKAPLEDGLPRFAKLKKVLAGK
jgi:6-phosphofructokinase 1